MTIFRTPMTETIAGVSQLYTLWTKTYYFYIFIECEYQGNCYAIGVQWNDGDICQTYRCDADDTNGAIYFGFDFGNSCILLLTIVYH